MRSLALLCTAWLLTLSAPAVAQTPSPPRAPGDGAGLRYLAWPGKAAPDAAAGGLRPAHAPNGDAGASAAPTDLIPRTVARVAPAAAPARLAGPTLPPARAGLTPASDWLRPAPRRAPVIEPVVASVSSVPAPAPDHDPIPADAPEPDERPVREPANHDPRAPRHDAPIFRLQPQTATQTPAAPPPTSSAVGQGARYYSLHRQNGRQPDAIPQTQPTYLDGLPVELLQAPASADLAQPPEPPTLIRNAQGRLQAAPPSLPDDPQ